jgi:hypothetical protein
MLLPLLLPLLLLLLLLLCVRVLWVRLQHHITHRGVPVRLQMQF